VPGQVRVRAAPQPQVHPYIEVSAGSLGHGLPIAVGYALGARHQKKNYRVIVMVATASWTRVRTGEAMQSGAHYQLNNLVCIVDKNQLQMTGKTEEIMAHRDLAEKAAAFGWNVIEIADGNDVAQVCAALEQLPARDCEKRAKRPSSSPTRSRQGRRLHGGQPQVARRRHREGTARRGARFHRQEQEGMIMAIAKSTYDFDQMLSNAREAYGEELLHMADEGLDFIFTYTDNVAPSTAAGKMCQKYPDRCFNFGIAEPDQVGAACGLALSGLVVYAQVFGPFLPLRAADQVHTDIAYNDVNVRLIGTHGGVTSGGGPTHNCIADLAFYRAVPN
jgi:transketolase